MIFPLSDAADAMDTTNANAQMCVAPAMPESIIELRQLYIDNNRERPKAATKETLTLSSNIAGIYVNFISRKSGASRQNL
ncbi:hypothetical protein PQR63_03370 [Herbaspirillum rhizosphaerae]|uniref:Uncharacterized protein n=1 Tax=Herbaspirillum rhizosphaerae TaxID=346179 RepID=A0ABW8Z308_9BURK